MHFTHLFSKANRLRFMRWRLFKLKHIYQLIALEKYKEVIRTEVCTFLSKLGEFRKRNSAAEIYAFDAFMPGLLSPLIS